MADQGDSENSAPADTTNSTTSKKSRLARIPDPNAEVIKVSAEALRSNIQWDAYADGPRPNVTLDGSPQITKKSHGQVYACPEPSCRYHDPSDPLKSFSAVEKHYGRKHMEDEEPRWICDKCDRGYHVKADFDAHKKNSKCAVYHRDLSLGARPAGSSMQVSGTAPSAEFESGGVANCGGQINNNPWSVNAPPSPSMSGILPPVGMGPDEDGTHVLPVRSVPEWRPGPGPPECSRSYLRPGTEFLGDMAMKGSPHSLGGQSLMYPLNVMTSFSPLSSPPKMQQHGASGSLHIVGGYDNFNIPEEPVGASGHGKMTAQMPPSQRSMCDSDMYPYGNRLTGSEGSRGPYGHNAGNSGLKGGMVAHIAEYGDPGGAPSWVDGSSGIGTQGLTSSSASGMASHMYSISANNNSAGTAHPGLTQFDQQHTSTPDLSSTAFLSNPPESSSSMRDTTSFPIDFAVGIGGAPGEGWQQTQGIEGNDTSSTALGAYGELPDVWSEELRELRSDISGGLRRDDEYPK